jgi:AcrR family transcriptional regulator
MSVAAPPSIARTRPLRERQRDEALRSIHVAAVGLVLEQGLAGTTVDQIATAAGVSTRTVFNYYATKEDAVLGLLPPIVPPQALEDYLRRIGEPALLQRTVSLLTAILRSMNLRDQDPSLRRHLLETFPDLLKRLHTRVQEASTALDEVLIQLPEQVGMGPAQRHALRAAATAVVQEAFILVGHRHFPEGADLDRALQIHREALAR